MFDRKELKANAKVSLKRNYWISVLAALILTCLKGSSSASVGNQAADSGAFDTLANGAPLAALGILLGAVALALVLGFVLQVFIWNPLEVGCQGCFVAAQGDGKPSFRAVFSGFKNGYGHIGMVMFFRTLFISLWTLLFIIPGIVKTYEYRMIPYILAENPAVSRKDAFAMSKRMMQGQKWNAFVLDLSFIGWYLLSGLTMGLLAVFYVAPYVCHTGAQLYLKLKEQN